MVEDLCKSPTESVVSEYTNRCKLTVRWGEPTMNVDPFLHLGEAIRKSAAKCEDNNKDLYFIFRKKTSKNTSLTCEFIVYSCGFSWSIHQQRSGWVDLVDLCRNFPRYVNPRDDPKFYGDTIQSSGCQLEVVPFSPKVRKNAKFMGIGWEFVGSTKILGEKKVVATRFTDRMFKIWLPSMEIHGWSLPRSISNCLLQIKEPWLQKIICEYVI